MTLTVTQIQLVADLRAPHPLLLHLQAVQMKSLWMVNNTCRSDAEFQAPVVIPPISGLVKIFKINIATSF